MSYKFIQVLTGSIVYLADFGVRKPQRYSYGGGIGTGSTCNTGSTGGAQKSTMSGLSPTQEGKQKNNNILQEQRQWHYHNLIASQQF